MVRGGCHEIMPCRPAAGPAMAGPPAAGPPVAGWAAGGWLGGGWAASGWLDRQWLVRPWLSGTHSFQRLRGGAPTRQIAGCARQIAAEAIQDA